MEAANEKIKAAINTTIDLYFIPSAERAQKYPLVMAGGDEVDLIYTANYCYYKEQVEKAGFTGADGGVPEQIHAADHGDPAGIRLERNSDQRQNLHGSP